MNKPKVYIVHHIDTEGPLYESLKETFIRINEIAGCKLDILPTKANLEMLQLGKYKGLEPSVYKKIKKVIEPHLLEYKTCWGQIDEMLYRMLPDSYRNSMKDSYGNGWIYNWHIMDHIGFKDNPRHRDLGLLNIFDHYIDILSETDSIHKDEINWHFHPIHYTKKANLYATSIENCYSILHESIATRLVERNWFPLVNRAGFHSERPDLNWFLEQWIPFDPSNQSIEKDDYIGNHRFGDWTGAPSDWSIYHPDIYDWRALGTCNRYVARCLNLKTRFRNITKHEIKKAFDLARKTKKDVYLGVTNHDFREMSIEIEDFYNDLQEVKSNFTDIDFVFSKASEAFINILELKSNTEELKFEMSLEDNVLKVHFSSSEPFGPQPYLAIKTKEGLILHDNLDFGEFKKAYFYTFDIHTIPINNVKEIVVATNDKYGQQLIKRILMD